MFGIANNTEFLKEIGIADAPEETKQTLIAGIENLAQKRLVVKVSDKLTEAQAEEFGRITDDQEAYNWLTRNLPEFQDMIAEVFAEIKQEILTDKAKVVG